MKKPRVSLYGQILLWFFLNLALVAAVLFYVLKVQFNVGLERLVTGQVEQRMVVIGEVMSADLREAALEDWAEVVARYEDAYRVDFAVLRPDGVLIDEAVGAELPEELVEVLKIEFPRPPAESPRREGPGSRRGPERRGPERRVPGLGPDRLGPEGPGPDRPGPDFDGPPPPPEHRPGGERRVVRPRLVFYERAGKPPRYWAVVHVSLASREWRHPPEGIIVASAAELGDNEVFFDWRPWLWALLAVLVVSALIWLPFVHRVTRRLRRLTAAAESISEGEFDVEVATPRADELGRLSRAVQRMARRLDEYVSGQKRFLGDIAHELCSPLARVRMSLGILEQKLPPSEHGKLAAVEEEVEELSQLVNELLDFSKASIKPDSLPRSEINLADLLSEVARREGPDVAIAIARTCVEGLGGSIRGWNREGGGFAAELRFPKVA